MPAAVPPALATPPLHERAAEMEVIEGLVSGAISGVGCNAVVEGEAGIGKTALLIAATDAAVTAGVRVLRARGSQLERTYAFGVAIAVLGPLVRSHAMDAGLWQGPAGLARSLFGPALEDRSRPTTDPFAIIHGLTWLVMNAAEHAPLLIEVDDAQWADDASMRWIHHLADRTRDLRVSLIAAYRTGEAVHEVPAATLARVPGTSVLRPLPLTLAAVAAMMAATDQPATAAAEIHAVSGGNPFYVRELLREAHADRDRPGSATAVPAPIGRFVAGRVAHLDGTTREIAEVIAVLDESATGPRVAALVGRPEAVIDEAVRQLIHVGVLHPSGTLAFLHPIVQASVYDAIPVVSRQRRHREAGLRLLDDGAPVGIVGSQLLASSPGGDVRIVTALREAAGEMMTRGESSLAAQLLTRALAEPPAASERLAVEQELAHAEALADPATAVGRYEQLLAQVSDPLERARLYLDLGHALHGATRWREAADAFEAGLHALGDSQPDRGLRDRLEAGFVSTAWVGIERHAEAEAVVERILREAQLNSVHRDLAVWVAFQRSTAVTTTAAEASGLVMRAIADAPAEELITIGQVVEVAAGVLVTTDALAVEEDLLTRSIAAAERAGAVAKIGVYAYCRAWPRLYMGRLADAIEDVHTSLRVSALGAETFEPAARAALAFAHLERGEPEAAAAAVDIDDAHWGTRVDYALLIPIARARIALARGDATTAMQQLDASESFMAMLGFRSPVPPDWRIWRTMVLLRLGRREEARAVAADALAIAREWGASWTLGVAHRAAGMAEGGRAGIEHIEAGVEALRHTEASLELARTQMELGAALRRHGRIVAAREVLAAATDLAHRLGAVAIMTQAREESVATGARPRRFALSGIEALTPAERRVVDLAASGHTNRQIAEALFVTPKAVEFHLANTYPKLGIASRRELAGALAGGSAGLREL